MPVSEPVVTPVQPPVTVALNLTQTYNISVEIVNTVIYIKFTPTVAQPVVVVPGTTIKT